MGGYRSPTRYPGAIRIGARVRRELGDLNDLAASIERDGLLHPIVVTPENDLIAGQRRLAAWRKLDRWDSPIPVHVVDIDAVERGEWAENAVRKDLTPSEAVELMRRLRPAVEAQSRVRQAELGRTHGAEPEERGNFPQGGVGRGRTRDIVAQFVGRSARSLAKAAEVVDAAIAEPDRYGRLQEAMDRSGKVHGPYKRLVVMRQAKEIRAEPPPLPGNGPYRAGVVDFPWPFDADSEDQSERGTHPYPLMTYGEIAAFMPKIRALSHDDAVWWFWVRNHEILNGRAVAILEAAGFERKALLTWGKDKMGRGQYLRDKTEHCILAVLGNPPVLLSADTTLLMAPRGGHSEKPASFYDVVERVCPAPRYADLFSHERVSRPGWDMHSTSTPLQAPAPNPPATGTREEEAVA